MLPGECVGLNERHNEYYCKCGRWLRLRVCRSSAGYYLGYTCPEDGPISRETRYLPSLDSADYALRRIRDGVIPYWIKR